MHKAQREQLPSVRDEIKLGNISLHHDSITQQLADIFIKPLGKQAYEDFKPKF